MADYDKDTAQLLNQLRGTPIGNRILNYLTQRNAMPAIEPAWLGESTGGQFSYPSDPLSPGTIKYATSRSPVGMSNTLLHELTHAADRQISRDALDYAKSDPQLYDAWLKLSTSVARPAAGEQLPERDPRQEMAYRMAPQWFNQYQNYRASNKELPAWGVADSAIPTGSQSAPSHINATLAQEFDILMDLASRAKKKK